jgi:DNA-directed RNA polymerase specialized sigma24 family protein
VIDRARLEKVHERALTGDHAASAEVFMLLQRPIAATLRRRIGPSISWDEAADLATDAIVTYLKAPGRFEPARSGLLGYVIMIAYRDALNFRRDRQAEQKKHLRAVELSALTGNDSPKDVADAIDAERILRDHGHKIVVDDGDGDVLRLFLDGERDTAAYAAKLGIGHLAEGEQRQIVKQRRDRIEQRLKRLKEDLT